MQYWWVNQNQTFQFEVPGGYMWSPKANRNGASNQFYKNMTAVSPGDVIFSFKDTFIKAVGIATGHAETAAKPTEFSVVDNPWSQEGWFVPVSFTELEDPIRPKNYIHQLRPYLPTKYSPLQSNGNGLQAVYLANVPTGMADVLITLLEGQVESIVMAGFEEGEIINEKDEEHESEIQGRTDISETEKDQLIKARRGQGVFKTRVSLIEKGCRVTGVEMTQHLRASHIKPWRDSTPYEKLDGNNGLLLSPHIDHLFDRGYISFKPNGSLLVSPQISNDILEAWNIDPVLTVGVFSPEQSVYLRYHNDNVFKRQ